MMWFGSLIAYEMKRNENYETGSKILHNKIE